MRCATRFAALERGERVFVERVAHVVGAAAQRDVVFLRAGEIEQRGAEAFLCEEAHVDLHAVGEQEADFVFAVGQHLLDARELQDVLRRWRRRSSAMSWPAAQGDEEIEIADGFLAAAQRAGGRDGLDSACRAVGCMRRAWPLRSSATLMRKRPVERWKNSTAFRMFSSVFSPKPARSRSFPSRASFSTSSTVPALKFFQRKATFFGPRRLEGEEVEKRRRIFFQELLAQAVVAGVEDFVDVLGHAVADAGKFGELLAVLGEFLDALGQAVEQFGGAFS